MIVCNNCGAELLDNAKLCNKCGTPITKNTSQIEMDFVEKDIIDKTIDDWGNNLLNKADGYFQNKNFLMAIRYYKLALKLNPDDVDLRTKLQKAQKALGNKMKGIGKFVLKIVVVLLLVVVGTNKCQNYMEEKERIAELERLSGPAKKDILLRIDEICKDITEGNYYNKHFVKDLKERMDRTDVLLRKYDLYMRFLEQNDIWTNSGVCEIVTAKKSNFQMLTPISAMIDVQFIDSRYGELAARKIEFYYEDGSWMVSDVKSLDDSFSLRRYSYNFVNWVEREYE